MPTATRRQVLGGLATLAATALVSGCGGGRTGQPTGAGVTVEHEFGRTTIPAPPKRVVTVGYVDQDPLLALGVRPVGVREWFGGKPYAAWPWTAAALDGSRPVVLGSEELSFEKIAKLTPDLIIGAYAGLTKAEYDQLSKIAPTVAQAKGHAHYTTPWQDMTNTIGVAVGKAAEAKKLVAATEAKLAAARTAHPEFAGRTVAVLDGSAGNKGGYGVLAADDPRGRLVRALGLRYPDEVNRRMPKDKFYMDVSREQLDLVDADVLVVLIYDQASRAALDKDPLFQRLNVVRRGAAVYLDNGAKSLNAAMGFSTVLSIPYFLDGFVPPLATAVARKETRPQVG
ncbi:iron-siderophore ABC transporter substrate-binding protein [Fodinicola acaciae]|uniref:iron-siderophore ABC transporter substrate-binding protein n=1 Tax=Fodinicola acaciae TaxID=2681555 RepID=UPI0013D19CA0|nr:iron-siderophore ABC transporter substrate-binding protein [Fodinicola acaciae]